MVLFACDPGAGVRGPAGACVSGCPALWGAGSAWESPGPPHSVAGTSPCGALPLRVPEPGRRPSSFSAPCPGPPAAARSADPPRPATPGLGPGPGAVLPPALARLLSGEPLSSFSCKGPAGERKGLVQSLLGLCSGARRSACGCGGQISSLSWTVSLALRGALR